MIAKLIYPFLFLSILINAYSCRQTSTNEGVSLSAQIESTKVAETINKKGIAKKDPAVIYRSNDLGISWSSFAKGIPKDATLSGIKQAGDKLYVSTDYHGVFVTSDGQDDWSALNLEALKGLDINCIEAEANKIMIGTLKHGVLISNDSGLSWKPSAKNIENFPVRAFIRLKDKIYAGTDAGIFASLDQGNTWSHLFGRMQILGFTALNGKVYAATQHGALMQTGNTKNWRSIYEGDALHDIGNDGKYLYAMTIGQQLLKTQNDGRLWENAQSGITRPPNYYTNELQHLGNDVFSAQWIGIYHSVDNGRSWKKLNNLPEATAFSTLEITDFGIIAGISIR